MKRGIIGITHTFLTWKKSSTALGREQGIFFLSVIGSLLATMNIFKKKTSPKEALRTSKREMVVATRGIEREIASLQLEAATKILARQLVRLRQQITNLQGSRAQIRGVATHTQALYASTSISTGMKGATKAMVAMNKQMAPAKQAKVIKEFQKQSAQMDMTIEMMSEAIDETLDKDEAEEETEELTNQVLDEIGVDIASQLSSAPKGRIASKNAPPNAVTREKEGEGERCRARWCVEGVEVYCYIQVELLITVTSIPAPGMDLAQLICRGCRTLLMYARGATTVRCSCCHIVNFAPGPNQVAHVNCGNCQTTLMYPNGAPSVKCAVCHYVTNISMANVRVPLPANRSSGIGGTMPSTSTTQTVVVENPMSVDESGKLVSNVVVGVTTEKK
ncbi:hypothetical protein NC653_028268 [Populus alba x Populus x berolinensis]|uniref:Zinc finger LSD1-type domain-containing protein n=1 Tax=Populus alba x Populus x berolinensis TaxID=444605 RepID=A0AAD6M9Y5_9ROSI|nr:hypothetical protein NC653_028268 [Populus alba x Populus x berolinensis]